MDLVEIIKGALKTSKETVIVQIFKMLISAYSTYFGISEEKMEKAIRQFLGKRNTSKDSEKKVVSKYKELVEIYTLMFPELLSKEEINKAVKKHLE